MSAVPEHGPEAEEAIRAELVRLTLAARPDERPELRVSLANAFAALQIFAEGVARSMHAVAEAMSEAAERFAADVARLSDPTR